MTRLKGLNNGQRQAIITKATVAGRQIWPDASDEDIMIAFLNGDLEIVAKKGGPVLVDQHGRCIPRNLSSYVCDADNSFYLDQPKLETADDYAQRINLLHKSLGIDTGVTGEQFKSKAERQIALIKEDSQMKNLTNGVWLPFILPKSTTDDLGETLELYLKGVGESYATTFSDRTFYNHRQNSLAGQVNIFEGSRHKLLLDKAKDGPVIGIYFPTSLRGYSIDADREQISSLPARFILSGMDAVVSMIIYPDVLARDYKTPGLDLAAFSWRSAVSSLDFKAFDGKLNFGSTGHLGGASGFYSGGFCFLG